MTALRIPYVGAGADGARRSAQIDREEADTLPAGQGRDRRLLSAEKWILQAEELERREPHPPTRLRSPACSPPPAPSRRRRRCSLDGPSVSPRRRNGSTRRPEAPVDRATRVTGVSSRWPTVTWDAAPIPSQSRGTREDVGSG